MILHHVLTRRHLQRLPVGFVIAASVALCARGRSQQEELFGIRPQVSVGWFRDRVAISNGLPIESVWINPNSRGFGLHGLTHDGARLVSINTLVGNDNVYFVHPTGTSFSVGPLTGTNLSYLSLERHPMTGVAYLTDTSQLFTLNVTTGTLTPGPLFAGLTGPVDYITGLAIDSNGTCIGSGWNQVGGHNYLYQVDLSNGQCTALGMLNIGVGRFRDIAFSASAGLWGSWEDDAVVARQGLYRIDLTTLTATQLQVMSQPYSGLAFGPGTAMTTYCTAKTSSQGCVPQVAADGIASPTANAGFTVSASQVANQKAGRLLLGVAGAAATPFAGGTLCLAVPFVGTSPLSSGGSLLPLNDCSGAWSRDFNTVQHLWPLYPAGTTIRAQWLGRDPGFGPPNNLSLSNALAFTLLP